MAGKVPPIPWPLSRTLLVEILKVTLASGLSFALAGLIIGPDRGYFAPLATVLIMQGSVSETLSRATQRVLGVIAGVSVALAMARFAGISALSISLLVFFSLLIGNLLKLGPTGTPQVGVSALMIMIVGNLIEGYWWDRILETFIGAVVGAVIHALVLPPNYLPEAQKAAERFARRLAGLIKDFSAYFDCRTTSALLLQRARHANDLAKETRATQIRALESLRLNIHRPQILSRLQGWMRYAEVLERISVTARLIARQIDDWDSQHPDGPALWINDEIRDGLRQLFALLAESLELPVLPASPARGNGRAALQRESASLIADLRQLLDQLQAMGRPLPQIQALGALLSNLEILIRDFCQAEGVAGGSEPLEPLSGAGGQPL